MTHALRHCTVRLERQKYEAVTALAIERGCTPSNIVRDAVEAYLGAAAILDDSQLRLARITEFMQIAIDIMIREQHPEYRDRIVAEADKRLRTYHGA